VIVVVAYLLTRSKLFLEVLDGHPAVKTQIVLILVFGILSIYGTVSGVEMLGAIVNVRDRGPMVAGLIGAAYRWSLGGFTIVPCSTATILAGLFGGLIWLGYKRKFCGITVAVLFAIFMEGLHMLLTLAICRPFDQAVAVTSAVALPMILANAAGLFIFALIIENLQNERKMQAERDTLLREMERKNTELAIPAEIQQSFLPDTITQIEGFEIVAKSVMAKEVGGDFFDVIPFEVIPLKKGTMGIMIADVSGKGIPAALFMALSRIVVRVNATWYMDRPAMAIRNANTIISDDSRGGMFVTLFYGILEADSHTLTYVNVGHNPPIICHSKDELLTELTATGIAIGALSDAEYTAQTAVLDTGDTIVLYTDGITEAKNTQQDMYGEERLNEMIRASRKLPAAEILNAILESVRMFCGDYAQSDDITLMVIRVK
jgi:sigma-B regulation protein RsbU (phosphoserine phosphatase)